MGWRAGPSKEEGWPKKKTEGGPKKKGGVLLLQPCNFDPNIQHGNPLAHDGHVVWECVFPNETWFGREQALAATACWESARGVWEGSCGCDHRDFLDETWVCETDY